MKSLEGRDCLGKEKGRDTPRHLNSAGTSLFM